MAQPRYRLWSLRQLHQLRIERRNAGIYAFLLWRSWRPLQAADTAMIAFFFAYLFAGYLVRDIILTFILFGEHDGT